MLAGPRASPRLYSPQNSEEQFEVERRHRAIASGDRGVQRGARLAAHPTPRPLGSGPRHFAVETAKTNGKLANTADGKHLVHAEHIGDDGPAMSQVE